MFLTSSLITTYKVILLYLFSCQVKFYSRKYNNYKWLAKEISDYDRKCLWIMLTIYCSHIMEQNIMIMNIIFHQNCFYHGCKEHRSLCICLCCDLKSATVPEIATQHLSDSTNTLLATLFQIWGFLYDGNVNFKRNNCMGNGGLYIFFCIFPKQGAKQTFLGMHCQIYLKKGL